MTTHAEQATAWLSDKQHAMEEALAGDVRSEDYASALVALAVRTWGRLDVAFNNAGTLGEAGPSTEVSEAGWNDAIAINLTGAFLGAKHQIAEMLKHGGGSVIFTSTFVGYSFAFAGVAAYAASKSGLIGLTQALAAEFGPRGVRVNAILPGAVETGMYREMNDTADKQAFMTNLHALKRVAQPEELARSVLYLASDDSAFVTGEALVVDGGLTAAGPDIWRRLGAAREAGLSQVGVNRGSTGAESTRRPVRKL